MATEKQIDKYWKERIDNRQYTAEQLGIKAEVEIIKIYEKALRNINQDIADVYKKYASKVGLGVDELSILLNSKEQSDFTRSIQSKMQKLGFNIEDIYLPNYIARLSRLDALKQQIYWKIAEIGAEEEPIHEELYTNIVKDTYKQYQKDVVNVGIKPTFATLDNRMVNQMVKERWYGRNYSDSVWQNTTKLAETLPEKIGAALTMGRSYMKTANELLPLVSEEFDNAMYAATRLVRTETIFHLNQAEAQASVDDGYSEYEYYAKVGSERTCEICEGLDGKVFKYTEQKVGVNYPPIHPNCRCSTRSVTDLIVPQMEKLSTRELKERYMVSGGRVVPILPELPLSDLKVENTTVADDLEKRWKESSAVKSKDKYNDEMNRISKLPTEEFKKKFDVLIKKVPEDYPLRKSLINTAKMIGWQEKIDLLQEAKKYKTPEEFAKNMVNAYHGARNYIERFDPKKIGSKTDEGMWGRGFYFSDKITAKNYGDKITEAYLDIKNPLIINDFKSKQELAEYLDVSEDMLTENVYGFRPLPAHSGTFTSHAIMKGHDAILLKREGVSSETVVFDPKQVYTRKQLTDVWEQAHTKTVPNEEELITLYRVNIDKEATLKAGRFLTREEGGRAAVGGGSSGTISTTTSIEYAKQIAKSFETIKGVMSGSLTIKDVFDTLSKEDQEVVVNSLQTGLGVPEDKFRYVLKNNKGYDVDNYELEGTKYVNRPFHKSLDKVKEAFLKALDFTKKEGGVVVWGDLERFKDADIGIFEVKVKPETLKTAKYYEAEEEYRIKPEDIVSIEEYAPEKKVAKEAAPKKVKVDKDLEQDFELYKNMKTLDLDRKIEHSTTVKEQTDRNIKAVDNKLAEGGITQQQYDEWIKKFGQISGERLEDLQVKREELRTMTPEQYRVIRDEKEKQLTENFKNIGVEGELTDFEKRIAVAGDIKLSKEVAKHKMRGAGAFYNDDSKTIYYTPKGIKQDKEALTKTFFHEFGHAIDTNYVDEKKSRQKLSDNTEWIKTLNKDQDEMVFELQQYLNKSPFWKGITLDQTRTAMRGMEVLFKGRFSKLPNASYFRRKEEIFARSYSVYRTKNKEFRDKMPNIFKYFDELTGYEQQ